MSTQTVVEVDQATRDELQPPCDAHIVVPCPIHGRHVRDCSRPAEWIARTVCAGCGDVDQLLMCEKHIERARTLNDARWRCECGASVPPRMTTERLR